MESSPIRALDGTTFDWIEPEVSPPGAAEGLDLSPEEIAEAVRPPSTVRFRASENRPGARPGHEGYEGAGRPRRPDGGKEASGQLIATLSHVHEAIIAYMINFPQHGLREIATYFGYSQSWISQLINSDLFKSALRERQMEHFSKLQTSLTEKLEIAAHIGLERTITALEESNDPKFVKDATSDILNKLGFGAKSSPAAVKVEGQGNNVLVVTDAGTLAQAREVMKSVGQSGQLPAPLPPHES